MSRTDWYIRANLKLRHLQLVVALDGMRSISKVASALTLTQPAVSKMLSSLESGLGVRLFERSTTGLIPTEHGQCLIRHAQEILLRLNTVQSELRDISEVPIMRVSLGIMPAATLVLAPRLIGLLESKAKDIVVSVKEGTMEIMLPKLKAGELDFLIGVLPNRPVGAELRTHTFYEDPFVVAVGPEHPLAKKKDVQWSDLNGYSMILPPPDAMTHEIIMEVLARHQISTPRRVVESISILTNIGLLQSKTMLGLVPYEMAHRFAALKTLVILPLQVPKAHRNVGVMWRADTEHHTIPQRVLKFFKEFDAASTHDKNGFIP